MGLLFCLYVCGYARLLCTPHVRLPRVYVCVHVVTCRANFGSLPPAVFDRCVRPLCSTAVFDRCVRPLCLTAVFDRCVRPLCLTAVFDRCV